MSSETAITERIQSDLRGPGGDWETTFEDVLGENLLVFKNRHRSIRVRNDRYTCLYVLPVQVYGTHGRKRPRR